MAVILGFKDLDGYFNSLKFKPLIVNDIDDSSKEDKRRLTDEILSIYNNGDSYNTVSLIPTCHPECGNLVGDFNIGKTCPICNTVVESKTTGNIDSILFIRRPEGVEKLINPTYWFMLNKVFTKKGFSIPMWICDNRYSPQCKEPPVLLKVKQFISEKDRSYNFFISNFDNILNSLITIDEFTKNHKEDIALLIRYKEEFRNRIFVEHIPIPNKNLFVLEKKGRGKYINGLSAASMVIDAVTIMTGIDLGNKNPLIKQRRTIRALNTLSEFIYKYYISNYSQKPGEFRKLIFGTRAYFTWRSVISSITEPHDATEIHMPWSSAVSVFRPHLLNKLKKLGYNHTNAVSKIVNAIETYDPDIDNLFRELIDKSANRKIPCLMNRNPTLTSSSILAMWVSKIKTDPRDKTTGHPILLTTHNNSDFDGDGLQFKLAVDNKEAFLWSVLEPHNNIFLAKEPGKISDGLNLPKAVITNMSLYISDKDPPIDLNRLQRFHETFEFLE